MLRRQFLALASAGAGTLLGCRPPATAGPQPRRKPTGKAGPDVLVVGAGAFGGWTAWSLRQRGAQTTLLDAYGPGNARSSSGGDTRLLREDYGDRVLYTRMAKSAHELWRRYQRQWKARLMTETGRLLMVTDAGRSILSERKERLERFDIATEVLDQSELRRRWPQIHVDDLAGGLYNPNSALLHAKDACREVATQFESAGGTFRIGSARPGNGSGRRLVDVELNDGSRLSVGTVVFACGPWLKTLFPDLLGDRLKVIRRDVFFMGTPPGDPRFSHPNLPTWGITGPSADAEGKAFYGFPDVLGRGMKACPTNESNQFDPDLDDRRVTAFRARRAYEYLYRRFPGLRGQPLVDTRVCQVTGNTDDHFLVDRHPSFDNVWLVGGGSGHGFKHGPALGDYVARRVLDNAGDPEYDAAFAL